MRVVSFRDLQVCTKFKGMNEIQMIALENDNTMAWVLEQIGFDTEYPISYIPSNHRDLQNKTGLGFQAVGDININSAYINSKMSTLTDRMIASAYTDPSLTRELSGLIGMRTNFRKILDNGTCADEEELPEYMLEPDRDYMSGQIKYLEELRDGIRGQIYNDRGEMKTFDEYKLH